MLGEGLGGWRLERRVLGPFFLACLFAVLLLFQVFGAGISLPQHAMCVRSVRVSVSVCLCISVCVCVCHLSLHFHLPAPMTFGRLQSFFAFSLSLAANLQWKLRIKLIFSLFDV